MIDLAKPLVPQLLRLTSSADYERWLSTAASAAPASARDSAASAAASRGRPRSLRLFESPLLESLSHTPWYAVPIVWLPLVAGLLTYYGATSSAPSCLAAAALLSAGIVVWHVCEYLLHRFLFHAVPLDDGRAIAASFLIHGVHHLCPRDETRLVFPPPLTAIITASFFQLWRVFIPPSVLAWPSYCALFAGGVLGYVFYDVLHYSMHHMHFDNAAAFSFLQRRHLAHHRVGNAVYGVSSPLFDILFGTSLRSGGANAEAKAEAEAEGAAAAAAADVVALGAELAK